MAQSPVKMQALMASYLKTETISHTRRVCSLYKRMMRSEDFKHFDGLDANLARLKIRAQFDKYKDIKDVRKGKLLLEKAEKDFEKTIAPLMQLGVEYLPFSKDGISYGRYEEFPDFVMDYYPAAEKAIYPYYFAKREQMKRDYLEMWKKKMIKPTVKEPHGHGH